jgi:hypothetical protein
MVVASWFRYSIIFLLRYFHVVGNIREWDLLCSLFACLHFGFLQKFANPELALISILFDQLSLFVCVGLVSRLLSE